MIDFTTPIRKKAIIAFEIPEGWVVEEIPEATKIAIPERGAMFVYQVMNMGGQLQVISDLRINEAVFKPDMYPYLKQFMDQVVAKQSEQIVLKKNKLVYPGRVNLLIGKFSIFIIFILKKKRMSLQISRWNITTDIYHAMIDAGILTEYDRVELINGELINKYPGTSVERNGKNLKMSPIGTKHAAHVKRLTSLLYRFLPEEIVVGIQDPIKLNSNSEPEPDISILKADPDFYENQHPKAEDIIVVVEVSDTTLEFDRDVKGKLYASSGIGIYWVIDIFDQVIEVYTQPENGQYKLRQLILPTDQLKIPDLNIQFPALEIWGRK